MTEKLANPDLEPYVILAQEMFRRIYTGWEPSDLNVWAQRQLRLIHDPNYWQYTDAYIFDDEESTMGKYEWRVRWPA